MDSSLSISLFCSNKGQKGVENIISEKCCIPMFLDAPKEEGDFMQYLTTPKVLDDVKPLVYITRGSAFNVV